MDSSGDSPRPPAAENSDLQPFAGPSSTSARSTPRWLRPALLIALVAQIGVILVWSAMECGHASREDGLSPFMVVAVAFVTLPLLGIAGAAIAILAFRRDAHRLLAVACCTVSAALALPIISLPLTGGLRAIQISFIDALTLGEVGQTDDRPARASSAGENPSTTPVAPVATQAHPTPPTAADASTREALVGGHTDEGHAPETKNGAPQDEIADWADREQVGRMQKVDVSSLDPALAARPLSEWLHELAGADGRVYWETNDCGEGGDGRESPTCVEADVKWRPCGTLSMAFAVADLEGKTVAAPARWGISLSGIGVSARMESLHEIPDRLREAHALDAELRANPEHRLTPDEAFEAAKRLEMRDLDGDMGPGSFGDWIERLAGPGRPVRWRATGCNEGLREFYLRDSCDDSWACAEAGFEDDHELVSVSIHLGTVRRGLIGKPTVDQVSHWVKVPKDGHSKPNFHPQLHDLPTDLVSTKH